jgi:hypothetical protein
MMLRHQPQLGIARSDQDPSREPMAMRQLEQNIDGAGVIRPGPAEGTIDVARISCDRMIAADKPDGNPMTPEAAGEPEAPMRSADDQGPKGSVEGSVERTIVAPWTLDRRR